MLLVYEKVTMFCVWGGGEGGLMMLHRECLVLKVVLMTNMVVSTLLLI